MEKEQVEFRPNSVELEKTRKLEIMGRLEDGEGGNENGVNCLTVPILIN